jgi:hypothetical protein
MLRRFKMKRTLATTLLLAMAGCSATPPAPNKAPELQSANVGDKQPNPSKLEQLKRQITQIKQEQTAAMFVVASRDEFLEIASFWIGMHTKVPSLWITVDDLDEEATLKLEELQKETPYCAIIRKGVVFFAAHGEYMCTVGITDELNRQ